jgi:peptide-methionine (S)-S-oxide reductase
VGATQHAQAKAFIQGLGQSGGYKERGPIVTELHQVTHDDLMGLSGTASKTFWPAEAEHDSYFERNPYQGYCMAVVLPKVEKAARLFADKVF